MCPTGAKDERGFRTICGSTLFRKLTIPGYTWTSVALGRLVTTRELRVAKHVFVTDKCSCYDIPQGKPRSQGSCRAAPQPLTTMESTR